MNSRFRRSLELYFLERVGSRAGWVAQALNAGYCAVHHAGELSPVIPRTGLLQTPLRFPGRKPCGIAPCLLRRAEPQDFAKMSLDGNLSAARAPQVLGERLFRHPAVNSGLFESLEGSGLGVRQPRFDAAFGEGPASLAGLDQQEFEATAADPIANGSHLFACAQLAKLRRPNQLD